MATRSTPAEVAAWIEAGLIRTLGTGDGRTWISRAEALRSGRAIADGTIAAAFTLDPRDADAMFDQPAVSNRLAKAPLALSSGLHAGLILAVVIATTFSFGQAAALSDSEMVQPEKMRLVYVALPGPGGGGGGGGMKQKVLPPKARREGTRAISSPIPVRKEPEITPQPPEPEPEPPKVEPEPLPPVEAPVAPVAADPTTNAGVLEETPRQEPSRGPGSGAGVGTGAGTGLGEGEGSGIGDGSGGGTGGGPYRPGSGIEPPSRLREVKPDYTEDARRRGVEGDVVMEIVVRHDGTVGDVRVLQGLGYGLDQRAIAAVRQWRFTPARRRGSAVDVLVEVAMEFKLR